MCTDLLPDVLWYSSIQRETFYNHVYVTDALKTFLYVTGKNFAKSLYL